MQWPDRYTCKICQVCLSDGSNSTHERRFASDISASQKHYHMRAWSDWPVAFSAMHFPFKRILVMMYTSMGVAISRQNKFCTQPRNVHDRVEQDQEMFSGQKIGA